MKVKDLISRLQKADPDVDVLIMDADDSNIQIHDMYRGDDYVALTVAQRFPDDWYDGFGRTVQWCGGVRLAKDAMVTEEIFVTDKDVFGSHEVRLVLTFTDGLAYNDYVQMVYPKLEKLTIDEIDEIDEYTGGRITDSGVITPYDVCIKYGKVRAFTGVMDTTNGHNPEMVKDINVRWIEDKKMFGPILCALYERDAEEILNSDAFTFVDAADLKWVKDYMKRNWDGEAGNYLMHIADDQDLATILQFVRYDRSDH